MVKTYFVKLNVKTSGYEKTTHHLVEALDEYEAGQAALRAECHDVDDAEFSDDTATDCGEWEYEVFSVSEVEACDLKTLRRFF